MLLGRTDGCFIAPSTRPVLIAFHSPEGVFFFSFFFFEHWAAFEVFCFSLSTLSFPSCDYLYGDVLLQSRLWEAIRLELGAGRRNRLLWIMFSSFPIFFLQGHNPFLFE